MAGGTALWVRLRARRRELGINTPEAAKLCGVTQSAYSKWEAGQRPSEASLEGIAAYLGVTRSEVVLLRSAEAPEPLKEVAELRDEVAALREAVADLVRRVPPAPSRDT